jgi:hypothetical protein
MPEDRIAEGIRRLARVVDGCPRCREEQGQEMCVA